jgi:hypothetical protein
MTTWWDPVYCVSTLSDGEIDVTSAPSAIDGVTPPNGQRILLTQQKTTPSQNTTWRYNGAGLALTATTDVPTPGAVVRAQQVGATLAFTEWALSETTHYTWARQHVRANAKAWEARGDGTTDDTAALSYAQASVGSNTGILLLPAGTYVMSGTSFTFTCQVEFEEGAMLSLASGLTLNVDSRIRASATQQIFQCNGSGGSRSVVSFGTPPLGDSTYPVRWWGAAGTGSTDDSSAIADAAASMPSSGGTLVFPNGTYLFSTSQTLGANVHLRFEEGAVLSPASGVTVTLNGRVTAHRTQPVFAGSGVVAVTKQAFDKFSICNFGAVADGTTVVDGTMDYSNPYVLTCASSLPFKATDVGKVINVSYAGPSGYDLQTTISGYTSSSTVTLTAPLGNNYNLPSYPRTVIFGTDNITAIQATHDAAFATIDFNNGFPEGGAVVEIPPGVYCFTDQLRWKESVMLQGHGLASTLLSMVPSSAGSGTNGAGASIWIAPSNVGSATGYNMNTCMRDFQLAGVLLDSSLSTIGLCLTDCYYMNFYNVEVTGGWKAFHGGNGQLGFTQCGVLLNGESVNTAFCHFFGCGSDACFGDGVQCRPGSVGGGYVIDCGWIGGHLNGNDGYALSAPDGPTSKQGPFLLSGCDIEGGGYGISGNWIGLTIDRCYTEGIDHAFFTASYDYRALCQLYALKITNCWVSSWAGNRYAIDLTTGSGISGAIIENNYVIANTVLTGCPAIGVAGNTSVSIRGNHFSDNPGADMVMYDGSVEVNGLQRQTYRFYVSGLAAGANTQAALDGSVSGITTLPLPSNGYVMSVKAFLGNSSGGAITGGSWNVQVEQQPVGGGIADITAAPPSAGSYAGDVMIETTDFHGLQANQQITVSGVTGTTEANGVWDVFIPTYEQATGTTVDGLPSLVYIILPGVSFVHSYTGGGTIKSVKLDLQSPTVSYGASLKDNGGSPHLMAGDLLDAGSSIDVIVTTSGGFAFSPGTANAIIDVEIGYVTNITPSNYIG